MESKCYICGTLIKDDQYERCPRHGVVCLKHWSYAYNACRLCADRESAEEEKLRMGGW